MADPITREQVERAIEAARADEGGISDALGGRQWDKRAPDYVRVAWGKPSLPDFIAALTRWRDELAAAEPWHARLVRLAQEAHAMSKACAEADDAFKVADAERERTRLARAAARDACHAARKALTEATTAAAIVEAAQQPASVQPTRPEPRYKVGDWVRVITSGSEVYDGEVIAPAIDPALRETARTAARMLLCGKWPMHLPRVRELPGFDAWNIGPLKSSEWAAQLERLLGDAP